MGKGAEPWTELPGPEDIELPAWRLVNEEKVCSLKSSNVESSRRLSPENIRIRGGRWACMHVGR